MNSILNRNHNWFDYDELQRREEDWFGYPAANGGKYSDGTEKVDNSVLGSLGNGLSSVLSNLPELMNSLIAYYGHTTLTGAEREQNEWNAAEAQKSRDFTQFMAENKYSMETQSMQNAGVNPALVYGNGNLVPTAANGAQAQGSVGAGGDIISTLMAMVRMPLEMKKLEQDVRESESREKKNNVEAHGAELQNQLTETTWSDLIEKASLSNEVLRADFELKKNQAKTEEEKAKLTFAETLVTNMDKEQREKMFPLLKEAQELTNAYKTTENKYQERQYLAQLRKVSAEIKNLVASALLADEQAKYAGRMTLGQVLGTYLNEHGSLDGVIGPMMKHSPLGGLIDILTDWLDDSDEGLGGSTSPSAGAAAAGEAHGAGGR